MTQTIRGEAERLTKALFSVYQQQKINARLVGFERAPRALIARVQLLDTNKYKAVMGLGETVAVAAGRDNVIIDRNRGVIEHAMQLDEGMWQQFTRKDMKGLEIGVAQNGSRVSIGFDWHYHHLVVGSTKSGKSTLIKGVIHALASTHAPQDLGMVIIDPHGDYAEFERLAHLEAPIAGSAEEINKAWTYVGNEWHRRESEGNRKAKRLIVISDECQNPINIGSKSAEGGVNPYRSGILADAARGAGKFRVNLIIGAQRVTLEDLPGMDMLNGRLLGRVDKQSTATHLAGRELPAHMLTGMGDFYYVDGHTTTRFVSAYTKPDEIDQLPMRELAPPPFPSEHLSFDIPDASKVESALGRPSSDLDYGTLGQLVGYAEASGKFPGRAVAENRLGITRHYLQRYREAYELLLAGIKAGKEVYNLAGK